MVIQAKSVTIEEFRQFVDQDENSDKLFAQPIIFPAI